MKRKVLFLVLVLAVCVVGVSGCGERFVPLVVNPIEDTGIGSARAQFLPADFGYELEAEQVCYLLPGFEQSATEVRVHYHVERSGEEIEHTEVDAWLEFKEDISARIWITDADFIRIGEAYGWGDNSSLSFSKRMQNAQGVRTMVHGVEIFAFADWRNTVAEFSFGGLNYHIRVSGGSLGEDLEPVLTEVVYRIILAGSA
ncbi:MAG: hypothetical protein FWE08_05150 [Oscillospiraceae bacterium]|nr:hypothetical protein [Oscillospiraceae bacterium]